MGVPHWLDLLGHGFDEVMGKDDSMIQFPGCKHLIGWQLHALWDYREEPANITHQNNEMTGIVMLLDSNNVRLLSVDYLDKCFLLNTIAEYCCDAKGIAQKVVTNSCG